MTQSQIDMVYYTDWVFTLRTFRRFDVVVFYFYL